MPSNSNRKNITKSTRAGLTFPVSRVQRNYRYDSKYKIGTGAAIYVTAVLEYLAAEILELAGKACKDNKRGRIIPRHVLLAVHNDDELSCLLKNVIFSQGGVVPHIESVLLPNPSKKKKRSLDDAGTSKG